MDAAKSVPEKRKTIRSLQVARALAALSVVAFHLSLTMGTAKYTGVAPFWSLARFGNLGVDLFFVISGYIIMAAHQSDLGRPERAGNYAYKRFVRIFPAYWLYMAGFTVAAWVLHIGDLPKSPVEWISAMTLVRLSSAEPPLTVAWTLFHEIAFYAVFLLAILNRRLGVMVFCLWMAVCLAVLHYPHVEQRTPFLVYTAGFNLNFLIGIAAHWLSRRLSLRVAQGLLTAGALALVAIGALDGDVERPDVIALAYGIGFGAVLAAIVRLEVLGHCYPMPWLERIGDASYSLYLVHLIFISVALKLAISTGLLDQLGAVPVYLATLSFAIIGGVAAYYIVEKNLIAAVRMWRGGALAKAPSPHPTEGSTGG